MKHRIVACRAARRRRASSRGFTLLELLVVMGIIVILIGITVVSVAAIARDSRLSSGANEVKAALGAARAMAMRDGEITLVTFRPRIEGDQRQYLEVTLAQWSGESFGALDGFNNLVVIDRFVPVASGEVHTLPAGVKVAQPWYGNEQDLIWITQSDIPARVLTNEAPNRLIAVMFDPSGALVTRNPDSDSGRVFIDFNNDGMQRYSFAGPPIDFLPGTTPAGTSYFQQYFVDDEPFLNFAPMLAVFDDDDARARSNIAGWTNDATRNAAITAYVLQQADQIHFNRYTGVVMK